MTMSHLLFEEALTGLENITMIVNLNPIFEYAEENFNILKFSSIAKEINVKIKDNGIAAVVASTNLFAPIH